MDFIVQALRNNPELAIFLTLAIGFLIGRLKFGSFSLGIVVGTLLAGVLIGQLDIKVHPIVKTVFFDLFLFTTGYKVGKHRIQGISDEFIPPVVHLVELDTIVDVHDGDAILMAQKLARELGLGVGISSGANFAGAVKIQNQMGDDAAVATVFPDSNKKYLSTDLLREEPLREDYMSVDVELTGYRVLQRVCATCCDTLGDL